MSILQRGLFSRPALAVACMLALAFAASALQISGTDWTLVGATGAAALALVALAAFAPWQRLGMSALLVLPIGCDLLIALLRQAEGGSTSGYGPLVVLPVLFVGLLMRRRHVAVMTAATVALFALPIVIAGAPAYPQSGWRGVVLWAAVAAIAGLGANRVIDAQRRQTELADQRARELDRVVAVQTAIATSKFDLDSVMNTVVEEAQQLTGADAAVVEIPDGDELVYRAVAGAAAEHLGLRLARRTALSGAALRSRRVLVCADSDTDSRADREASRRVGARSIVVVPLLRDRAAAGVLEVYSAAPDAFGPDHVRTLAVLADVLGSALARAELLAQLRELADTDALTGLANRRSWYHALEAAIVRSRRHGHPVSVLLLDLDGFKEVNDRLGHSAGDLMLRTIASHWSAALRDTDLLGRVGGDEFAALLEHADEQAAFDIVGRLRGALPAGERFSAGAATWDGEESVDELVARADFDMYADKRSRRASQ
jgi:diguanylate cyclase (GGDEF)-like protein